MSQISRKVRIRPAERKTAALARTEFKARLKARMIKGEGPDEVLDPEIFEDWDDAADLLKHFKTAPVHNVKRSDLAGTRKRAKPRARTTVRARGQTRAREKARRKTRKTTKGAVMLPHNTGLLPPIVRPINPPPKRYIGVRFIQPEVDTTKAKFRRQRIGIGKCTGGKLKDVTRAFSFAYEMLECAKYEIRAMKRNPVDARTLWHASREFKEASLAYWFGRDYSLTMLRKIDDMLTEWSRAFRGGFRNRLPVFIRCKSKNGVGGGPARHIVKNTIELFPRYFDMPRARQSVTMLHEMGHRCESLLKPRDERHDLCSGGWNNAKNMCYRDSGDVDDWDDIFQGGNPRILAEAATGGRGSAKKALLNNIDNYVCYMWNRYVDHGEQHMYLLPEGAKPITRRNTSTAKPVG